MRKFVNPVNPVYLRLTLAAFLLIPAGLLAAVDVPVTVDGPTLTYYDLAGATIERAHQAMLTSAPVHAESSQRMAGFTDSRITWTGTTQSGPGSCQLETASVTLQMTIKLPRWTGRDTASVAEREQWDRFVQAVRAHEDGHVENSARHAKLLAQRLGALGPQPDCHSVQRAGNETLNSVIGEARAVDAAYDRDPRNSQGTEITFGGAGGGGLPKWVVYAGFAAMLLFGFFRLFRRRKG